MSSYHGIDVFLPLYKYKMRVIEWCKKYKWESVCEWDMDVRKSKSGKSLNFLDYDMGLYTFHFDHTTFKNAPPKKCEKCGENEHKGTPCPFRNEPGTGSSTGQKKGTYTRYDSRRQECCYFYNNDRCLNRWCRKVHACKMCYGPMPYFECREKGCCAYSRY